MELTFWNMVRMNLLSCGLEYMMYLLLFWSFFGKMGNKKKIIWFAAAYEVGISLFASFLYYHDLFQLHIMRALYCYVLVGAWAIYLCFVYRESWRNAVVLSAFAEFFYLCAMDMTGFITTHNYDLSVLKELLQYIALDWFGGAAAVALMILVMKYMGIHRACRYFLYEAETKKWWRALLLLLPEVQMLTVYLINEKRMLHNSNPMATLLCLFLVSGIFNYATQCDIQKKQLEQQAINMQQQEFYIQNLEKTHQNMRMFGHDYKNMMYGLYIQAEEGNLREVQEFVSSMLEEFEDSVGRQLQQSTQMENIRRAEIKGLFLAKVIQAQKRQVQCELEVLLPIEHVNMPMRDFCRMAGILLDNALEAVEGTESPHFSVMLSQNEQCTTLRVKNPVLHEVPTGDIWREGYSTKGAGRGTGLASLRRLLDSYEQVYSCSICENGVFIQEIKIQEGSLHDSYLYL